MRVAIGIMGLNGAVTAPSLIITIMIVVMVLLFLLRSGLSVP
ncbi:hypothetical protein ACUXHH_001585 [Rothia sp. 110740021-2]